MDRIHSMRVFQRVCDEGSFAAAARALDLSPAAVTRVMADLEQGLGVRLLHRTTRRLALTQAGEVYLDHVRRILVDIDEAHAQVSAHATELAGELRIGASAALATHVLAPLLAGFRALYPQVRLDIDVSLDTQGAIEDSDLTLFIASSGFDADVIARTILESDTVLVASPEYLRRKGSPRDPQALAGHDLLVHRRTGARADLLRLWPDKQPAQAIELPVRPVLTANNADTLLRAVLGGAGITAFPLDLVAPYVTSGQLQRVLAPWVTGRLTVYAALPSRRFIPERTRRFLDYLVERTHQLSAAALAACEACRDDGWLPAAPLPDAPLPITTPADAAVEADTATTASADQTAEPAFVQAGELLSPAGVACEGADAAASPVLLDVRSAGPAARPDNDLAGALRADLGRVPDAVRHLPLNTPLVTVCACRADAGAIEAARELRAAGYSDVRVLRGGLQAWRAAGGR